MFLGRRLMPVALVAAMVMCALAECDAEAEETALTFPITLEGAVLAVEGLSFDEFVDESYRILLLRDPDSLWYSAGAGARDLGLTDMVTFTDVSLDGLETTRQIVQAFLDQLLTYDKATLSPDQIITFDSFSWILNDRLEMAEYPFWSICIGPSMYGLQSRVNDLLANLPIESLEDAEAYIQRLEGVDEWFAQLIGTLSSREAAGIIPPNYELEMSIMLLENDLLGMTGVNVADPEALPAYTFLQEKLPAVPDLTDQQQQTLLALASDAVRDHVIPGFQALRDHFVQLQSQSGDILGVSRYDNGEDYFGMLVRHHTTSDITVDEVYQLGLQEVARLQDEMRSFAESELGWPASLSMTQMNSRLDGAKLPLLQGEDLLAEFERLLAETDAVMDEAFSVRPTAGVEVRVDPEGCPACYSQPGTISDDMGYMMTTLVNLGAYTMYDDPVLVHHESIPGHHYQIALAMDLDVPLLQAGTFREDLYYLHPKLQAFSEGWALYAERLAVDLGLYDEDPISYLLSLRLWLSRTARLVVQAGLHTQGWTWDEVVAYLREAVGFDERPNRQLFHISYPGQACSYSVFSLFVLDIRQRAMDELGDKFDLKAFHWELLRHGIIPLQVLEGVMEDWIDEMSQS
ncbi:DUF885 family protein [Candidatus Bipolaricaulota bacterium]